MLELELKAVVPDAAAVRQRLLAAGAVAGFRGLQRDRRYDRDGELAARDEVLRLRRQETASGEATEEVAWKGPTRATEGYKARRELSATLAAGQSLAEVIGALGYREVHAIDRFVEFYHLDHGVARLEWYPELDTLLEVEGDPATIERLVAASAIDRDRFSAEPLDRFVRDYLQRTGRPARLHLSPGEEPDHWPR